MDKAWVAKTAEAREEAAAVHPVEVSAVAAAGGVSIGRRLRTCQIQPPDGRRKIGIHSTRPNSASSQSRQPVPERLPVGIHRRSSPTRHREWRGQEHHHTAGWIRAGAPRWQQVAAASAASVVTAAQVAADLGAVMAVVMERERAAAPAEAMGQVAMGSSARWRGRDESLIQVAIHSRHTHNRCRGRARTRSMAAAPQKQLADSSLA